MLGPVSLSFLSFSCLSSSLAPDTVGCLFGSESYIYILYCIVLYCNTSFPSFVLVACIRGHSRYLFEVLFWTPWPFSSFCFYLLISVGRGGYQSGIRGGGYGILDGLFMEWGGSFGGGEEGDEEGERYDGVYVSTVPGGVDGWDGMGWEEGR